MPDKVTHSLKHLCTNEWLLSFGVLLSQLQTGIEQDLNDQPFDRWTTCSTSQLWRDSVMKMHCPKHSFWKVYLEPMSTCPSLVHWMLTNWRADSGTILQGRLAVWPNLISIVDQSNCSRLNLGEYKWLHGCLNCVLTFLLNRIAENVLTEEPDHLLAAGLEPAEMSLLFKYMNKNTRL